MSLNSKGKLVVAEVPVHPTKLKTQISWNKFVNENGNKFPSGTTEFESLIYGDNFTLVEMDPEQNEVCYFSFFLLQSGLNRYIGNLNDV